MKNFLFAAIADVHRTAQRPVCRVEEDIMETQDQALREVVAFCKKHELPLLCAGDFFDSWKCGHDIVSSSLALLEGIPFVSCYGQHELPSHDMQELFRSPLTTLMVSSKTPTSFHKKGKHVEIVVGEYGKPPGKANKAPARLHVLLQHKMTYLEEKPFPQAKGNVKKLIQHKEYSQFDVVITGDNHKMFKYRKGNTLWVNCGCLYITSAAEQKYVPGFWIFFLDKEGGIDATHFPVSHKREHVSGEHLEEAKREKEWDSDFAKTISERKGQRPTPFVDVVQSLLEGQTDQVKKKTFDFMEV